MLVMTVISRFKTRIKIDSLKQSMLWQYTEDGHFMIKNYKWKLPNEQNGLKKKDDLSEFEL